MSFLKWLFLVFVAAKLFNEIYWSWFYICLPVIFDLSIYLYQSYKEEAKDKNK